MHAIDEREVDRQAAQLGARGGARKVRQRLRQAPCLALRGAARKVLAGEARAVGLRCRFSAAEEVSQEVAEGHPPERISTSRSTGSSATAISFSISRPQPGQQNCRNCGRGSMKRAGSPTIGFDASIGKSLRTQLSL